MLIVLCFRAFYDALQMNAVFVSGPHDLIDKISDYLVATCRNPDFCTSFDECGDHSSPGIGFSRSGRSLDGQHTTG